MDHAKKSRLLGDAQAHIARTTQVVGALVEKMDHAIAAGQETFYTSESDTAFEDEMRARAAETNTTVIREQMAELVASPYFARLDLGFDDEPQRPYYIAKYSASELGIYSWTSAVAALRFETPGVVSYKTPRHGLRGGQLVRRDQYMIARGHLNFMTTELQDQERELIYQEHFSVRKTGFVLPEVVAQMEKAQDQVIRADHGGPFVISGPAGSGKTTLALHRVAFLRQSPETTALYPAESILVLVQDMGTEDYFSHLLPELGIHDVQITTFGHWALGVLGLGHYFYHARPGRNEEERDRYEFAKLRALGGRFATVTTRDLKSPNQLLLAWYRDYLDDGQMGLLAEELEEGALDRFDLTLLLFAKRRAEGVLMTTTEDVTYLKGGYTKRTRRPVPLEYSLVLVDEFQNYLPEQLRLLRGATTRTRSILYIGDLAQQTQLGALRDFAQIGEKVTPERAIKLAKVYRNTRQILEYIRDRGYPVEIPEGVSDGPAVAEHEARDVVEALQYIVGLTRVPGESLGIIARDPAEAETYRDYFSDDPSVKCLTMREAQGVEFEVVVLVGVVLGGTETDEPGIRESLAAGDVEAEFSLLRRQVDHDLIYVALTRAMRELHMVGTRF